MPVMDARRNIVGGIRDFTGRSNDACIKLSITSEVPGTERVGVARSRAAPTRSRRFNGRF
jgi:hypothetical protein